MQRFRVATEGLEAEINLSNSAADLLHPEIETDWVRPGIMLYGGTPGGKSAAEFGLRDVTADVVVLDDGSGGHFATLLCYTDEGAAGAPCQRQFREGHISGCSREGKPGLRVLPQRLCTQPDGDWKN